MRLRDSFSWFMRRPSSVRSPAKADGWVSCCWSFPPWSACKSASPLFSYIEHELHLADTTLDSHLQEWLEGNLIAPLKAASQLICSSRLQCHGMGTNITLDIPQQQHALTRFT